MYPNVETKIEVDSQLDKFKWVVGLFKIDMTILTRDKIQSGMFTYMFVTFSF